MSQLRGAAIAVASLVGAGVAAVAAGHHAAGTALGPPDDRPDRRPDRAGLPAGFTGPHLTLHAFDAPRGDEPGSVTLTRSLAAQLPGRWGLAGRHCHLSAGPVLGRETAASEPHALVRRLDHVSGAPEPGTKLWLTPQLHSAVDAGAVLGPGHTDVEIPGELGPLPAWFVPGDRATWVVAVHGLGATRAHPLNLVPFLREYRLPSLLLAHRGDPGAPPHPGGIGNLGATEWRDVDAAVGFALSGGAHRVIVFGWSAGATAALHTALESGHRERISGLVLDSPVLEPDTTLRALVAERHVPRPVVPLAVRAARGRMAAAAELVAPPPDPARLATPTLLVHGPGDAVAPWGASRALADARPDLVTLHTVPDVPHAAMWNADPEAYEEVVRRFLVPVM